jgi:flagellar hook-associated protein 2
METQLNLDSLTVDKTGRVSFSGLGSGIDIQGTVDAIIEAKRLPIDSIEQRISERDTQIAALQSLRSLALGLRDAVAGLRGAVSYDKSGDVFAAKQAFATSRRADTDPPSSAADLLGVTVTNQAQATSHTVEIQQIATAHKVASGSQLGALADPLGLAGVFGINGASVTVAASDSLLDLRDKINAVNTGSSPSGVTASLVSVSAGEHVLVLTADETGASHAMTLTDDSGTVLEDLGVLDGVGLIENQLQAANSALLAVDGLASPISRESNTIDDVFEGVTLSLFKAEAGTTIDLAVERDLGQVKGAITEFVDAYNAIRIEINALAQTEVPADDDSGAGVLAGTSVLSEARARLAAAVGAAVESDTASLAVLAEIGITFKPASEVADPLAANSLVIDEAELDEALLNQTEAVRSLFNFQLASSDPAVRLAGFDGQTGYLPGGHTLNIAYAGGSITSANLGGSPDGADDGTVTVNGTVLTVTAGPAKGLKLLYSGEAAVSGVDLDVGVGIGAKVFHAVDGLLDETSGLFANEIEARAGQNDFAAERVTKMEARLERERERLLERFVQMETALTTMNRLLDSLRQQFDAAFNSNR